MHNIEAVKSVIFLCKLFQLDYNQFELQPICLSINRLWGFALLVGLVQLCLCVS